MERTGAAGFADRVRIKRTERTQEAGVADLEGVVYGETTPSVTGVDVIRELSTDFALNVYFESRGDSLWFSPELVELIDHAPGTELRLEGVDTVWIRREDGSWAESRPALPKRWWQFWK